MSYRFHTHEVRELAWVFEGPGLLSSETLPESTERDETLRSLLLPHEDQLRALDRDPQPLKDFIALHHLHGRLGRYFETLLRYFLLHLHGVEHLLSNAQIRDPRTIGELDLVFRERLAVRPRHWEASIKFYLCTTDHPDEARELRFFMGTLTEDRFDLKLKKLIDKQLRLPLHPKAQAVLDKEGLLDPDSRALLKGFLYYPAHLDWRNHPHPPEVSPHHIRGWWTTSARQVIPRNDASSKYCLLDPARWLAPFQGWLNTGSLMTHEQLLALVRDRFTGALTWGMLHRELMVAEVVEAPAPPLGASFDDLLSTSTESRVWVKEISRGNILHGQWPELARASALNQEPSESFASRVGLK